MATEDEIAPKSKAGRPSSVLFVCGMNCIRSPMAEYLTRHLYGSGIFCRSAGAQAGEADPFAMAVMEERGIPLTGHEAKTMEELEDGYYDLVVTLSPQAHHKALELTRSQPVEVEYWPTQDPSEVAGNREQILEVYRQVRDGLERRIKERFGD